MGDPPDNTSNAATIPLDQVWGFDIPGTRDIRELEPEKFGERIRQLPSQERFRLLDKSMIFQIRAALDAQLPKKGETTKSAFAVLGTGREALEGAYSVLVGGEDYDKAFPFDSNVTIVFFSHLCGQYVHVERIERRGKNLEVKYRVVPHMTTNMTWHLALIPLGTLPIGKHRVEVIQLPGGTDKAGHFIGGLSAAAAARIVCGSFSFSVIDRADEN
jgi:hypothetical protein